MNRSAERRLGVNPRCRSNGRNCRSDGAALQQNEIAAQGPSLFADPFAYNQGPCRTPMLTSNHCHTFGAEGKLLCQTPMMAALAGKLLHVNDPNGPERVRFVLATGQAVLALDAMLCFKNRLFNSGWDLAIISRRCRHLAGLREINE